MILNSEEKKRFIEFSDILNKDERSLLVDYLEGNNSLEVSNNSTVSANFKHCQKSINEIFSNQNLKDLCEENPEIATQVSSQILKALDGTVRESIVSNPYVEEIALYEKCQAETILQFVNDADYFINYFHNKHFVDENSINFYHKILKEKDILQKEPLRLSALKEAFENDWHSRLNDKIFKWEMEQIDKAREELCKELYSKADNFKKLKNAICPFTDFLETGRLWDMSIGIWRKTDFNVLSSYSQFLEKEKEIKELAEMLGRLRGAEDESLEIEVKETIIVQGWTTEYAVKSELVGIHESDDLGALLPSEVALLSDHFTEPIFYQKFAEKKLLTFDYTEKVSQDLTKEIFTKQAMKKPRDKGPIIVSIDTSGSMAGTPEMIAKLMCFALMQIALRDNRKCFLISYSTSTATLDLSDLQNSIPRLIDFLSMSFHAGTDPEAAFVDIMDQLEIGDYSKSDVVFISDFIMPDLSIEMKDKVIRSREDKGTLFHSLIVSNAANPQILRIFDNNWFYDCRSEKAIVNLATDLRKFQRGRV